MQVFTVTYLKTIMEKDDKRLETLVCREDIPHHSYDGLSFEKELEYEILGVHWENNTFVMMNDWGEAEEIAFGDPRFKLNTFTKGKDYPVNFLLGIGMNQMNHWKWF